MKDLVSYRWLAVWINQDVLNAYELTINSWKKGGFNFCKPCACTSIKIRILVMFRLLKVARIDEMFEGSSLDTARKMGTLAFLLFHTASDTCAMTVLVLIHWIKID